MFSFILFLWAVLCLALQELKHFKILKKHEDVVYCFTRGHTTAADITVFINNYYYSKTL